MNGRGSYVWGRLVHRPVLNRKTVRRYGQYHGIHSTRSNAKKTTTHSVPTEIPATTSSLARLSTINLLRSIVLGHIFMRPMLRGVSMRILDKLVHPRWTFLSPDKNILIRSLLRMTVYNHFCAGTDTEEVKMTVHSMKKVGYVGVVIAYGREIVLPDNGESQTDDSESSKVELGDEHLAQWLQGNLKTLRAIGDNDYIALKYTGAGPRIGKALRDGEAAPHEFQKALHLICELASAQGTRVIVDAEQQVFQDAIDEWTLQLMDRYNRGGNVLVYNTIQTYLKKSRQNTVKHLNRARQQGFALGIKQVRGAYLSSDIRSAIWDTKEETDSSYNSIARDLILKDFKEVPKSVFPELRLFLAGHNQHSIQAAVKLVQELAESGAHFHPIEYGQLQGMADNISCDLLQACEESKIDEGEGNNANRALPRPYKALTWGSVQECMHYLYRRAVENSSATARLNEGLVQMQSELWRRISKPFTR